MKRTVLLLAVAWIVSGCSNKTEALRKKLTQVEALHKSTQDALESQSRMVRDLQQKLNEVVQALSNSTHELQVAEDALAGFERAQQARQSSSRSTGTASVVPPPIVKLETNRFAAVKKTLTFPVLMGGNGEILGTNAVYSMLHGKRAVFWFDTVPAAFDIDALHPEVLRALNVDPEAVKEQASAQEKARQTQLAAEYRATSLKQAEDQRRRKEEAEASARAALELAKQQELAREKAAQEQMQWEAIENERFRAEAAMREADAAMVRARNSGRRYWILPR